MASYSPLYLFAVMYRHTSKERSDSLTNSVKESSVVEPSVATPATENKVSISDVFSQNSNPESPPTHRVKPTGEVVGKSQQNGTGVKGESPVPSPKPARRARLRSGRDVNGDTHTDKGEADS